MKTLVLNFEDLANGKAIKAMQKAFARVGTFVVTAEADPKVKTSAGVKYKTLNLSFNDGQKVSLDAKSTGDVFQVRVNGKVMPIKNHENIDKAIVEIVNVLDKGRAKFQAKMTRVKVELPKGLKSTAKKQHELLKETVSELDMQIEEATQRRDELKAEMGLDSVALDAADDSYRRACYELAKQFNKVINSDFDASESEKYDAMQKKYAGIIGNSALRKIEDIVSKNGIKLSPISYVAFDAVHPANVKAGDNVHHPKENRTGMVRRITGKGLEVRTTRGLEIWAFDDVELVQDDEAFDGVRKDAQIGQIETYMNKLKAELEKEGFECDVTIYRSGKGSSRDVGTSYGEITISDDTTVYEYFKFNANGYSTGYGTKSGDKRSFSGSMQEMKAAAQSILDKVRKERKEELEKRDGEAFDGVALDGIKESFLKDYPEYNDKRYSITAKSGKVEVVFGEMKNIYRPLGKGAFGRHWDVIQQDFVGETGKALDGVINGTKSTEILLSQFKKRSHSDYDIEQLSEFVDVLKKGDVKKSYQAMNELDTAIREQLPDSLLQFFANQGFKMIGRIPRGGAFDYTGQPRDTNGQYAEGKQGSLKARANKVRFAVKKAFKNPFRG